MSCSAVVMCLLFDLGDSIVLAFFSFLTLLERCVPYIFIYTVGHITVPLSGVKPAQLYHHILAHSDVFGMQTVELQSTSSPPDAKGNICLHINVCPQSLGPTTSPQLSKLLEDAQEHYHIHIIALCEDKSLHSLELVFYLLLVDKYDKFPRPTCESAQLPSSQYGTYSSKLAVSPEELTQSTESELHLSVRKHRLKLGLEPVHRSSTASQLVLDGNLIQEHVRSLEEHFEGVVKNAVHHMRRDELWKRMLYGRCRTESKQPIVQVSTLLCFIKGAAAVNIFQSSSLL